MHKLSEDLYQAVENMPSFPSSVSKILSITSEMNVSSKEIVKIIMHDPVLTMKMLKLVNSSYFGMARQITSVHHAFVLLGLKMTKNLLIGISLVGVLKQNHHSSFNRTQFLLHSLAVAVIAKLLVQYFRRDIKDLEDFFITGLLHDFGKIVLDYYRPDIYKKAIDLSHDKDVSLIEAEKKFFGIDHCVVGKILADRWNLPISLQNALEHHHDRDYINKHDFLTSVIYAADVIALDKEVGFSGNYHNEEFPVELLEELNLDTKDLPYILNIFDEEMEKAKVFLNL